MEISIKSEADSRMLVYPLIKALYNYGTIAVYTSNKYLCRLIENELEGGFKNVRVLVSPEADLEDLKRSDGFQKNKYDFIIYDNVGATDYDMLICILTNRISESYIQDLLYIIQDEKTQIIKFGAPAPTRKEKVAKTKPGEEVEEDPNFNKWNVEKSDEEVLQELISDSKSKWCKFPSFDMIENMEARHIMPVPDDGILRELYKLFGTYLSVDERQFMKGARVKDESSSDIDGADVR